MANYGTLKAAIDAYIKRNGQQRITGDLLNAVLNAAVDALGMGYQFLGIATAQTDPGTPDARVFYIAGAGTYPNFGSTEIPEGSIGIFCYGDTWEYEVLQVGSGGGGGSEDAVLYTPQTLTTEQKGQARSNIGAGIGNYSKPGTGIPKTDLAEGVQTSLGKADSAYQKPGTGIPATDIASGVIPTSVVQYSSQTLTDAQKAQARTNIGATAPEVFWAVQDVTTSAQIEAALNAGKLVVCKYSFNASIQEIVFLSTENNATYWKFYGNTNGMLLEVNCHKTTSVWSATRYGVQLVSNMVGSIPDNDTSTTKYPHCKAVADYLAGLAETWTFTLADGTTATKKVVVLPDNNA